VWARICSLLACFLAACSPADQRLERKGGSRLGKNVLGRLSR